MADSLPTEIVPFLHQGHAALRQLLTGLTTATLDWKPGPETNSIAALVTHAMDAERHLTALVADVALVRDREAAFRVEGRTAAELTELIDATERDVDGYLARITPDRLAVTIVRPNRTATGAGWLLVVAAHSREHLGQATLTRQLAEQAEVDHPGR